YRLLGSQVWDSVQTDSVIVSIPNLTHSSKYEYKIQTWCDKEGLSVSAWTSPKIFTTLLGCLVPKNVHIASYNWTSAKVVFVSDAPNTILAHRIEQEEKWNYFLARKADTLELLGLPSKTVQLFKVAAICESSDTSEWSAIIKITTPEMPQCYSPKNLKSESISPNTVTLSWTSVPAHINYHIAYKEVGKTQGDTIEDFVGTSYKLTGLKANTPYSWAVRGNCDMIVSQWSSPASFKTNKVSIETEDLKANFHVFADKGHIAIQNPNQQKIDKIELYTISGQLINTYTIASTDHLLIPTQISDPIILLRLFTAGQKITYKLCIQ
ncbi:MAG: fibronectin type III domain-containing protein, partial [Bacteroidales bacterium]